MKKLAVLALGVLVAACSETPTEAPLDSADMLAMQAAQTETQLVDVDECQDFGPVLVICRDQSGVVNTTVTSSGVSSFALTNWTSELTLYRSGELVSTTYSEIKLDRNLFRDGDRVVLHQDSCFDVETSTGFQLSATTFFHAVNGEVTFDVRTDEGCGA